MSAVYVGTYAKYNSGSIAGAWLDLTDYADRSDFYEACAKLHADEADPEFMFKDWEEIPDGMISECSIDEAVWEWLDLDDSDKELLQVYRDNVDSSASIDDARDAFVCRVDGSKADAMEQVYTDSHDMSSIPDALRYAIDWDVVARDSGLTFIEPTYRDVWVFN